MPITATFKGFQKRPDGLKIQVNYDDGEDSGLKVSHFKGSSDKELVNHIRSEANHLEKRKAYDPTRHIGKTIDITPEPPPEAIPPTAEEIAKAAFMSDWRLYLQMKKAVDAGLESSDLKAYTDQIVKIKAGWQQNYVGDL